MAPTVDFSTGSLSKLHEEICGNIVEVMRDAGCVTAMLTDGEGEGTGAGVTATFFAGIARKLLQNGSNPEETVRTIAEMCSGGCAEGAPAPGFAVLRVGGDGVVCFASMNMPLPIVLLRSRLAPYPYSVQRAGVFEIASSKFTIKNGTSIVVFSEGLLAAGKVHGAGWNRKELESFLQAAYEPKNFDVKRITQMLLFAAKSLEQNRPAQDISVLALKLAEKRSEVA